MFIELHMIQNFAPSNLNRDDTGNPKDAEFGGVRRARISSQSFKRAIRLSPVFAKTTGVDVGTRSRWMTRLLRKSLEPLGKPADEIQTALDAFVPAYASKYDSKFKPDDEDVDRNRTAVLIYFSADEMQTIVNTLTENWQVFLGGDKKATDKVVRDLIKLHKNVTNAPDIALFGRMLAEKPDLNIDAACQVAHALSTHRVTMEMDFFTAVDDLTTGTEDAGAGMMGFTAFDSACFYRYVRLDWDQLVKNLDGDSDVARKTVEGFMRAAVEAIPSGKQNTFAAHNPPSLLLCAVREGSFAWSLTNAFERPAYPSRDLSLVGASVDKLGAYWQRLKDVYGTDSLKTVAALAVDEGLPLDALHEDMVDTLDAWVNTVMETLP
ncbi:MAG: type I-E CRISPR-associated protein Cas7/Cse4/CasC [Anaerolineae bacterium]|nr:type I-E CRISPR-associated protein Cas7/Cse4/CasC [Anaerolineae bacterium]